MKDFLKHVLATIVGLFGFGIVMLILGFISLIGIMVSGNGTTKIDDNSVLVINLQGDISEKAEEDFIGRLTGNRINQLGLNELKDAIKKAQDNDKIKGIYLQAGVLQSDYATLQELRNTLADFKKSGKWIIAYGDSYTQGAYYLTSIANKLYLNPEGMLDWHGIAARIQFNKGLYDKVGLKYQVFKVGKFKSYTERYTEEQMSEPNHEQVKRYINGLWDIMVADVSKSRNIAPTKLRQLADSTLFLNDNKMLVSNKIVDGLLYYDQLKAAMKKQLGIDQDEDINQVTVGDVIEASEEDTKGDAIAVYYCEGAIVRMPSESLFGGEKEIVSDVVCSDLADLADDDDVKAVVLRINSGGGDAYASEQLWRQVKLLNAKKPVVVSMSGMAASGAYYMSMGARWLVAQPTTLTGSIGIFACLPDFSELYNQKLGIRFDEEKTNEMATFSYPIGMVPMARHFNATEATAIQNYVNRGYVLFRQRVAEGRKMKTAQVEDVAQGRVWLGTDALRLKLVDQLGGLEEAMAKAAQLAKLKKYHAEEYPLVGSFLDQLLNQAENHNNYLDSHMRMVLGEFYQPFVELRNARNRELLQARIPFTLDVK
ncbi:signal peptide peptidase SppA [Segatella buccae]|uniref:signal peptide peptidase SppA n=1 Tax=Segatella buccae TaxID=28126 RepID=UPI00248DDD48|nr:signal peptide peptidase SppA [Segatella buccae]